ncbi:MAG: hypothetical protein KAS59_08105 [Alphaproteobacteria bacterium]|nr:hypothetical protein [Alphaproteobacteria bacterium]
MALRLEKGMMMEAFNKVSPRTLALALSAAAIIGAGCLGEPTSVPDLVLNINNTTAIATETVIATKTPSADTESTLKLGTNILTTIQNACECNSTEPISYIDVFNGNKNVEVLIEQNPNDTQECVNKALAYMMNPPK